MNKSSKTDQGCVTVKLEAKHRFLIASYGTIFVCKRLMRSEACSHDFSRTLIKFPFHCENLWNLDTLQRIDRVGWSYNIIHLTCVIWRQVLPVYHQRAHFKWKLIVNEIKIYCLQRVDKFDRITLIRLHYGINLGRTYTLTWYLLFDKTQ